MWVDLRPAQDLKFNVSGSRKEVVLVWELGYTAKLFNAFSTYVKAQEAFHEKKQTTAITYLKKRSKTRWKTCSLHISTDSTAARELHSAHLTKI